MSFDKTYLTTNNSYSGNKPKYIVIHNTGNFKVGATAQAHASSLRNGYISGMSWHIVTDDNNIYQNLDWDRGAWHVGINYGSNNLYGVVTNTNSICIEMCVQAGYDYEKAFQNTVKACKMVMKELGIPADRVYQHYDVCTKNCPSEIRARGDWKRFKELISGNKKAAETGTQASEFAGLSETAAAAKILELIRGCDKSGIIYSVTAAQMILESGYVTTDLARNANNVFGMKCTLSGNTWPGSTWDGKSKYTKQTAEQTASGSTYHKEADFRKYPCIEDNIGDHAAYLLGAKNGDALRYAGLTDCKDYRSAIELIKKGGYATDTKYVSKICSIIERFGLDKYDAEAGKENTVAKTTVQKAVEWALATAKDNSHGYDNTKGKRTGPDYACSSFIAAAWRAAGLTSIPADAYTATMRKRLLSAGFEDVSDKVNLKTGKNMIAGDVVLLPGKHVEMVVNDNHDLVGARGNAFNGAENGKAGDQTGQEIAVAAWYDYGWRFCLRYTKDQKQQEDTINKTYIVQAGLYKVKSNAQSQLARVKKVVPDAFIKEVDGQYRVQAGSFSGKANANARKKLLTDAGISAIVKTE